MRLLDAVTLTPPLIRIPLQTPVVVAAPFRTMLQMLFLNTLAVVTPVWIRMPSRTLGPAPLRLNPVTVLLFTLMVVREVVPMPAITFAALVDEQLVMLLLVMFSVGILSAPPRIPTN